MLRERRLRQHSAIPAVGLFPFFRSYFELAEALIDKKAPQTLEQEAATSVVTRCGRRQNCRTEETLNRIKCSVNEFEGGRNNGSILHVDQLEDMVSGLELPPMVSLHSLLIIT